MPRSLNQLISQELQEAHQPPFTLIKAPNGASKRVHFQANESLSDRIDRLTDTLYRMDIDSKPVRKPYKPYITSP